MVILFVRMWVEIYPLQKYFATALSSSSWGCELKYSVNYYFQRFYTSSSSWGCELKCSVSFPKSSSFVSSSSWGCELKYVCQIQVRPVLSSSSSWGCELKYNRTVLCLLLSCHPLREDVSWNGMFQTLTRCKRGHPLREDVSWNVSKREKAKKNVVILFVRMWVEICCDG